MKIKNIGVTKNMLKCAYFMMSADGKITPSELQKFDIFGKEYDEFENDRNSIISECEEEIKRLGIKEAIKSCLPGAKNSSLFAFLELLLTKDHHKRYMLWMLVNIAYADGEYAAAEKELVRYAAKEMEMDESLVLEMEDSAETLLALKKKEKFIAERKSSPAALEKNIKKDWDDVINSIHALVLIG